jgi:hypothetical protein
MAAMDAIAKPWSVAVFESQRPHMTNFVRQAILPHLEDFEVRRVVVRAPVKSGKREMVEYIAMRDSVGVPTRVHAFISAWHRKADEDQREELVGQNMAVFSIMNGAALERCRVWMEMQLAKGLQVVLHLDECDHGSGSNQTLSLLWREVRDNERISCVLYSATPEEVLYSGEVENDDLSEMVGEILDGHQVRYTPPAGYCGPAKFLEENLVHIALPFFEKVDGRFVLSAQGKEIVRDLKASILANPRRNLIVLRLSYSVGGNKKEHKAIHQFIRACGSFPDLAGFDFVADIEADTDVRGSRVEKDTVEWSNPTYWRRKMPVEVPTIILIDQKSSRSTEWACHDRVFATHDFRKVARFSTISQAVERVNHYEQKYGGFQPIRVYCHKKTLLLSADKIDYKEYCTSAWLSKKVDRRTSGGAEVYMIRNRFTNQPHPHWPTPVPPAIADRALQVLECFAPVSLAERIKGSVKNVPIYETRFHSVTEANWTARAGDLCPAVSGRTRSSMKNPFPESRTHGLEGGRFKGYFANSWRVLDYETEVNGVENWGARAKGSDGLYKAQRVICYREGVLGVAVRIDTGRKQLKNTLLAFKSMYGSHLPRLA